MQSKVGFAARPSSRRSGSRPGKGRAAAGIVADAGGLHALRPAVLALLPCSPVHPAMQHAVIPLFQWLLRFCCKRSLVFCPALRAWRCLRTHHFSYLLRFGWDKVSTRFHLMFPSSFCTIKRLGLAPLFAPEMVRAVCPKSSCFEDCSLPLLGF